jgi:hypothetical protein
MLSFICHANPLRISLKGPAATFTQPIVANAVADASDLLRQACHCEVGINLSDPVITLQLPSLDLASSTRPTRFSQERDYPYFHYPNHHFSWNANPLSVMKRMLYLESETAQGVAMGLYALLQEHLGFRFVHPRQTIVPEITTWPLPPNFRFSGQPVFDKKGFHLHTQHPLELTEPLHNPDFPGGMEMIEEYLLWLARNGQNYFEFCLLEGVDLPNWIPYASQFVQFGHERGILCSVDLSLHMIQQRAYKLVQFPPVTFKSFEKQIDEKLELLLSAGWDFVNMEFSMAEFVGAMAKLRHRLREYVVGKMREYPQVKLMGRQHVVKPEDEIGGRNKKEKLITKPDPDRGILIHTVMCYAIEDQKAPVYELDNFHHLYDMLIAENQVRETWYYPESAYWITFDNSVPMLLLPYLSARLRDIQTMQKLGIPGHVTFSSGWEWGYWLVDWSIARWSWEYKFNGQTVQKQPLAPLFSIADFNSVLLEMNDILFLQNSGFIQKNHLRYLCPENIPDEFPAPGNKQFQPRAEAIAKIWARDFPQYQPGAEPFRSMQEMSHYADLTDTYLEKMAGKLEFCCEDPLVTALADELMDAIRVTNLRQRHRVATLSALAVLSGADSAEVVAKGTVEDNLNMAYGYRKRALSLVEQQEARYRYPLELIARPLKSYTVYDFGYLYTVSDLFWWQREEEQIKEQKFGPFFMNPWRLLKIAGIKK